MIIVQEQNDDLSRDCTCYKHDIIQIYKAIQIGYEKTSKSETTKAYIDRMN